MNVDTPRNPEMYEQSLVNGEPPVITPPRKIRRVDSKACSGSGLRSRNQRYSSMKSAPSITICTAMMRSASRRSRSSPSEPDTYSE
jgi:hypothetical protein